MLREAGYSLMAILQLMLELDREGKADIRKVIDTPHAEEDIFHIADQWLTTLDEVKKRAVAITAHLEIMMAQN